MRQFVILRRNGWATAAELEEAGKRSVEAEKQFPGIVSWIRSYVIAEENGALGTVCIYEATDPETVRRHAAAGGLPADEIMPIADTLVVSPDPERAAPG